MLRTAVVLVVGVFLSFVLLSLAGYVLASHVGLAHGLSEASRSPSECSSCGTQFVRAGLWSRFVVEPIIGLGVGLFVGIFQKKRVGLIAVGCLIPLFLFEIAGRRWADWSSLSLLIEVGSMLLQAAIAVLAAWFISRLMSRFGGTGVILSQR